MKGEKYNKDYHNDESIEIELKTHSEKTTNEDHDDILITAETYDRFRDRSFNIKNKKYNFEYLSKITRFKIG